MNIIPDILMVSWNRREYFERTLAHLLADDSDFRLYFWDNASVDGVADLIAETLDPRIAMRHFNKENVGQSQPWHWFLDTSTGDIAGKLDDDILGPRGWMSRFSSMIAADERFGLLGGWVYLESDWDEAIAAPKIIDVGPYRVFRNGWVAGCIFLARKTLLQQYSPRHPGQWGVPMQQMAITRAGYITGYPLPLELAENLDDPRSPYCRMNRPGGWDEFAAYTARMRNFKNPQEYGEWIARDARSVLETSIADQLKVAFPGPIDRFVSRVKHKLTSVTRAKSGD